jgi:GntR family transcriptional regulator
MSSELNKPLYVQIQEYIAELILSGKLKPDSKIRSERDFSEELGVSRMTVRRALTEMVSEGLLERRHGSGTYVAKPRVTYESHELIDNVKAMQDRNLVTSSQLLEFGEIVASRRLAEQLEVEIGHSLYRLVILRIANRTPVTLERNFFPCARCPGLEEWDLEKSSIFNLLVNIYNANPLRVSQTVEAISTNESIAKQMRIEEGFPLLMLSRIIYSSEDGKPIEFSQHFMRSDFARIHVDIRLDSQSPDNMEPAHLPLQAGEEASIE